MNLDIPPIANRELSEVATFARTLLAQVIPKGAACALIGSPDHGNVGDSAIWLGQRVFLRERGVSVRYSCSDATFDDRALRRAMPNGIVLLQGGGNWGTIWPGPQAVRERVLERLRDYTVVQLPQSIHYENGAALERTRDLVQAHPAFTLYVRDRPSFEIGTHALGARTVLCPDSAVLLEGTLRRWTPEVDCLVLARDDRERLAGGLDTMLAGSRHSVDCVDWLVEPRSLTNAILQRFTYRSKGWWAGTRLFQSAALALWDQIALERMERGCRLLSRGRIVVTDRLHAHIISTMLGIPNVVLDNSYGKLGNFMNAWTLDNPLCHRAESMAEAAAIAESLLDD